jgi:hypothetical protein
MSGTNTNAITTRPEIMDIPARIPRTSRRYASGGRMLRCFDLKTSDVLALTFAVLAGCALFLPNLMQSPKGDALSYLEIGRHFAQYGLTDEYPMSSIRTYGYGLFLVLPILIGRTFSIDPRVPIFATQLAFYLAGSWLIRAELARYSLMVARTVFVGLCLNVFVLIYLAEPLTDGLTVALIFILGWIIARLSQKPSATLIISGSVLLGGMVMIRPGNLFLLPCWALAVVVFCAGKRWYGARYVLLAAAAFCLPLLPQAIYNAHYHGSLTPLPTEDLDQIQQKLGIYALKYITFIGDPSFPPVTYREPELAFARPAQAFYENPIQQGAPLVSPMLKWYVIHPLKGIATLTLHTFNLIDQDIIFPYPRTLIPAYRWPVGILNHAMIAFSLLGLVFAARNLLAWGVRLWVPCALAVSYIGGFLAIYAFIVVEARFGLPLIAIAAPLSALGVVAIAKRPRLAPAIGLVLGLYVVGALFLSEWIRDQAPTIRAEKQRALAARLAPVSTGRK